MITKKIQHIERIEEKLTFGKYKGYILTTIPLWYRRYLIGNAIVSISPKVREILNTN